MQFSGHNYTKKKKLVFQNHHVGNVKVNTDSECGVIFLFYEKNSMMKNVRTKKKKIGVRKGLFNECNSHISFMGGRGVTYR